MEYTEAQINEYLAGQKLEQQGVVVQDMHVTLADGEFVADLHVAYAQVGLSAGVRVRGVPVAVDGQLYVQVGEITLDDSVSGFMRLVAKQVMDQVIKHYSGANGIAVPIEDFQVDAITLRRGQVTITGRTR
jgi:hypothetical protein